MAAHMSHSQRTEWRCVEKLALASAVVKGGEQNWASVGRIIKPFFEENGNPEKYNTKNCAITYSRMLEDVSNPKRKRERDCGGINTPGEQILKNLVVERIDELKERIKKLHTNCAQLNTELVGVTNGKYNDKLEITWEQIQKRKSMKEFQSIDDMLDVVQSKAAPTMMEVVQAKPAALTPPQKVKEEVLDEGHSSPTPSSSSQTTSSKQIKTCPASPPPPTNLNIHMPPSAPPTQQVSSSPVSVCSSPRIMSPSTATHVNSSPSRNISRIAVSPRIQASPRPTVTSKTKTEDKNKNKAAKPTKKKPIVPKIKIKALQSVANTEVKGAGRGDKRDNKITDVFHFDYQPPSGSSNSNSQYSSLYQDPKMASFLGSDTRVLPDQPIKPEDMGKGASPTSSVMSSDIMSTHSQSTSPAVDGDGVPFNIDTESPTYKSWKKSILVLWKSANQHKFAPIFHHPVTDDLAPGYSSTVIRPIDLTTIKKKIDTNVIKTTAQFHRDMLLMFTNALMYNNSSHSVYAMAIQMMTEVMDNISEFYNTHNQAPDKHLRVQDRPRSRTSSHASQ